MNETFIRNRISALRLKKGVSEYRMSTDLGHSKSYIQSISSGRSLPSLAGFLCICEYLSVTPQSFFNDDIENPSRLEEAIAALQTLSDDDFALILAMIKRLQKG